jgi:putative SOS response-associated peptidase YedK
MCTNYVTTVRDEIRQRLDLDPPTFDYEPELWPGHKGPMLIGENEWRLAMFGLVPYFSKDGKDFRRTYNARSETADEKPTYRGPWRRRQLALIPMTCFFEPSYESGRPVRWRIERRDGEPFTVAAIWDTWKTRSAAGSPRPPSEPDDLTDPRPTSEPLLHSFSMLTINADGHALMGRFHAPGSEKRSLVIVPPERRAEWLASEDPRQLLREFEAEEFTGSPDPLPPRKKVDEPPGKIEAARKQVDEPQLGLF